MQIDDRLVRMNRQKNRKKGPGEEEDTLLYADRKREESVNRNRGVFEEKSFGGINSMESVFDRTAVFRTEDM
ncbi:MAG: hypothetical protein K6F53_08410 [Lachnospiraceae bacterium]|nr:hypothetical protein [Lachnospiraceae bacterium]